MRNQHAIKIPGVVRKNTVLFAIAQAFVGVGNQLVPALGAIMVVQLLGAVTLAGVGTSILNVSRFLVAYPIGAITDAYGRKAGVFIGLTLSLIGALIIGLSQLWQSFPAFLVGLLVFGLGVGATYQLRVAAADMYPPTRRAEGLGYVLSGSLIGAFGGPILVSGAEVLAPSLGTDPIALAWLLVPATIIPGLLLVTRVRPDPKDIAEDLPKYYPDYRPPATPLHLSQDTGASVGDFVRQYPKRAAFIASFAAQGNMTMMMAMTSLVLHHEGHALPAISLSVSIHVVGMFGLSLPLGWLTDRVGRRNVMMLGVVIAGFGSYLIPASPLYAVITTGTFLVGLGWSCVNVASSALIADTTGPAERGRAIGTNDAFSAGASIVMPLLGGPIADAFGFPALGVVGVSLMIVPILMLVRLSEPSPGRYRVAPAYA